MKMGVALKDLTAGLWWVRRVTRGQSTYDERSNKPVLGTSCRVKIGILSVWGGAPFFDAQVLWLEANNGRGDRGPRSLSGTPEKAAEFCSPENMRDLEVLSPVVCPWAMGWLDGQDAEDTLGGGVLVKEGYSSFWSAPRSQKYLLQKGRNHFVPPRQMLAFEPEYERKDSDVPERVFRQADTSKVDIAALQKDVTDAAKGLVLDPNKPPIPIKTYSGEWKPPADENAWRKELRYEDIELECKSKGRYIVGTFDDRSRFWQLDAETMEWICTTDGKLFDTSKTFARKFEAKAAINTCKKPPFMVQR